MLVAQHQTDIFEASYSKIAIIQFLTRSQQQATQAEHVKIASLTFTVASISPWLALATLGGSATRHVCYDSPQPLSPLSAPLSVPLSVPLVPLSVVGVGVAVGCGAAGSTRFAQAQDFIDFWQPHFLYAGAGGEPQTGVGRFFLSATFADRSSANKSATKRLAPAYFEPAYVFVPEIQVTTGAETSAVTFNCPMSVATDIEAIADQICLRLQQLVTAIEISSQSGTHHQEPLIAKLIAKDVTGFEGAVAAALRQVQVGALQKVVLADVMDVVLPQPVETVRSLQALRQNHPDCTVFSVGNGRGQSFIGASPERLLSIINGQLTTDALAGTASRSQNASLDRQLAQTLMHSKKERYEHQVVVAFILEQLRSLNLKPSYAKSPQLLQLLHIQHLHTAISAPLNTQQNVQPLDILAKLHPTPAVAGVPRQAACDFIHQHETFDRGLYTAPLGWIDTNGNSEFIVGIRSALIDGCKARLYAGAGIVAGSEPKKELAEIKLKLQTLLNALI